MINPFLNVLKEVITKVREKNQADPNVKTADSSVFDRIKDKLENVGRNTGAKVPQADDIFNDAKQHVDECQVENEADPNVETADKSVYEDMMKELEELRAKVKQQDAQAQAPQASTDVPTFETSIPKVDLDISPSSSAPPTPVPTSSSDLMAMTNSMGGSLELGTGPDMGAPMTGIYIPDGTLLKVLEYSENKIILDGKESRFVLIEFNGQRGWVLESYLNFN